MEFDPNNNLQTDIDPIDQMNIEKAKTKQKIIAITVLFITFIITFLSVYFSYKDNYASETNEPHKPVIPDCSIAYDCELYTKSEYTCKYKDENNDEKEIKCPWTEVKENQYKTTTPVDKKYEIENKFVKEFDTISKNKKFKDYYDASNTGIIIDGSNAKYFDVSFMYEENSCPKDNYKYNRKINGFDVSYTCYTIDEEVPFYEFDIEIDNKYKIKESTDPSCGGLSYYLYEDKIIAFYIGCAINMSYIRVSDANSNDIFESNTLPYPAAEQREGYVDFISNTEETSNEFYINPYIKNNKIYYIDGKQNVYGENNTCNVKTYDLNTNKEEVINSFRCKFYSGD